MRLTLWMCQALICTMIMETCAKGAAKVRPGKNKNRKKDRNNRFGARDRGTGSGDGERGKASKSGNELDYLTAYMFRNASHEERLLAYLFHDYNPVARAVVDGEGSVTVQIDFVLLRIHGLDERSQVLTTTGLIIAEWQDNRLRWDPDMFGNVTHIIVKADLLWLPELAVMNGAEELIPDFERIRVLISNTGLVHWEPGGIFRTTCDIDIAYFPFDVQHCPLLIGAYSYYASMMNITNASNIISTHDFRKNGEWHVWGTTASWAITVLECCDMDKGYSHVVFTLHLKRRSNFYVMNIVLPCLMLSVLIMIGFFLPPDAGEKISLGISVLLAFTVFLLMIADNIPRTSLAIPLMVIYLTSTMTLGTISICMTVIVLNVHHRGATVKVPRYIRVLFLNYLARLVCVTTKHRTLAKELYYVKKSRHKLKTGASLASHDGNGLIDDLELMGLTHGNSTTPTAEMMSPIAPLPVAINRHVPLTSHHHSTHAHANGPRAIPCTPPHVQRERNRGGGAASARARRPLVIKADTEPVDYSTDWHDVAHVLDRFFFWMLFALMTVSAIFTLLYPKYSGLETQINRIP